MTSENTGNKGTVLLAAGGTGGHLFPAEALAHELKKRGYSIALATDARADRFAGDFPADHKSIITSATIGSKNPIELLKTFWKLFSGYRQSAKLISDLKPVAAVGFGGYPTLPPLIGASRKGVPCLVHEQNAILGRANRMLAKRVKGIAVGFAQVGTRPATPIVETGNPIRPIVETVMDQPYALREKDGKFRLVIFGGSQGARFFSEILPEGLRNIAQVHRQKLSILQQAREEDAAALKAAYHELEIEAEVAPFFKNMPKEIANAHFVMARAGASSVTELAVIGRPSLLIPLPGSLDGDQAANAISMADAQGAFVVKQQDLTGERLGEILTTAINDPVEMQTMAKAAKKTGIPDAAQRLADCVECVISGSEITALDF